MTGAARTAAIRTDTVRTAAARTGTVRTAIVGGGLAGAALAWRLTELGLKPTLFTSEQGRRTDATQASGGLLRGFETDPARARAAAESLAELRASPLLRGWADYRELDSTVVLPPGTDPAALHTVLRLLDELLPGSAELRQLPDLKPFLDLPPGSVAVVERQAGYLSPAALRDALLAQAVRAGATVRTDPVLRVLPEGTVRTAGGATAEYDTVVLATGPWTPGLLAAWGLPGGGLRSKRIQYTLGRGTPPGLGAFVDETCGLYGRPAGPGRFLLGLPTDEWDVDPAAPRTDADLARRVAELAAQRLGLDSWPGPDAVTVAAADCYAPAGGLRLRACLPGAALLSFTGGTGGAAKYALLAARSAAAAVFSGETPDEDLPS
ncbi:FAD-dependent oxidoreductase [Kitasatospora viridis]|uniref:Glycine/D-amino acid oxidase-like deaminating enzyme n=1 Tax=Kitasatospora viridis TaxID=281105 RepID=A0A561UCA3_9ACTN|nr:FAD-dependent oxidoreductase [Kitasatospora viridis]TWF96992.1 glycine/D-amino acid oxidase-like deaminating enzyme [Kitasatospora viridis]